MTKLKSLAVVALLGIAAASIVIAAPPPPEYNTETGGEAYENAREAGETNTENNIENTELIQEAGREMEEGGASCCYESYRESGEHGATFLESTRENEIIREGGENEVEENRREFYVEEPNQENHDDEETYEYEFEQEGEMDEEYDEDGIPRCGANRTGATDTNCEIPMLLLRA